ncbi:MAG TPA: 30S ribosomal protein S20 [Gammaproteobacteria bacterium]|nr:30S ribosomal protein S20 [Gammaproteobacteria bacterium]
MANSLQARKRARQAEKHRQLNASQRTNLRTHIKNVIKAIESGDKSVAEAEYKKAVPVIDSATVKGHIHKNKAARHKSRLNTHVRAM